MEGWHANGKVLLPSEQTDHALGSPLMLSKDSTAINGLSGSGSGSDGSGPVPATVSAGRNDRGVSKNGTGAEPRTMGDTSLPFQGGGGGGVNRRPRANRLRWEPEPPGPDGAYPELNDEGPNMQAKG